MKLVIRPSGKEDILRQYRYYLIEQETEVTAERFLAAVQSAIEQVRKRPGIGTPKALNSPALANLRSWPVKGFPTIRIYYLVSDQALRVIRVLHGKRDIDSTLERESET